MAVVLGAVYLVIHAYITHESIQHVWSQVHSPFWRSAAAAGSPALVPEPGDQADRRRVLADPAPATAA